MDDPDLRPEWLKAWERLKAAYPNDYNEPEKAFQSGFFAGEWAAKNDISERIATFIKWGR